MRNFFPFIIFCIFCSACQSEQSPIESIGTKVHATNSLSSNSTLLEKSAFKEVEVDEERIIRFLYPNYFEDLKGSKIDNGVSYVSLDEEFERHFISEVKVYTSRPEEHLIFLHWSPVAHPASFATEFFSVKGDLDSLSLVMGTDPLSTLYYGGGSIAYHLPKPFAWYKGNEEQQILGLVQSFEQSNKGTKEEVFFLFETSKEGFRQIFETIKRVAYVQFDLEDIAKNKTFALDSIPKLIPHEWHQIDIQQFDSHIAFFTSRNNGYQDILITQTQYHLKEDLSAIEAVTERKIFQFDGMEYHTNILVKSENPEPTNF